MSSPNFPFSVSTQMGVISANLNSSMLFNFLFGLYTPVYAGTMYLYLSKKPAGVNRRIVLSAISVLYLLCFLSFIVEWYTVNWSLVINGLTQESIFISTAEGGPPWIVQLIRALLYAAFIVSDGLLIWRCYNVWGWSFRVVSIPLILLFAEFSLFVSVTVLSTNLSAATSEAQANLFNSISSALVFVSLGTTISTTFLIGYRIYAAPRSNGLPSTKLYNRIAILVIETAAIYSFVLLFDAISIVIPGTTNLANSWSQADFYLEGILTVVPGLVPTIMIARLALVNPNTTVASAVTHISGLQFDSQHRRGHTGISTGIVHTTTMGDARPTFGGEGEKSIVYGTRDGYQVDNV